MKDFLFEIKTRLGEDFTQTLWGLFKLYFQKIRRKNFYDKPNEEKIDVVIPTIDKDFEILSLVIESLKNIGNKINKIYVVSPAKETIINFCNEKKLKFVDELSVLGFSKENIRDYSMNGKDRRGWLFQQFLKYGMKDLVEQDNYLVLDSDTILTNTNTFIEEGKFIFFKNTEWHKQYFKVFKKIFGYKNKNFTSFTSHMMIFNKKYLTEMLLEIEQEHSDNEGEQNKWYNIIYNNIDKKEMSSVSDYENYGQWMFIKYNDLLIEKPLYNKSFLRKDFKNNFIKIMTKHKRDYKTISFHDWIK